MARPKSNDKRNAILHAATRVIVAKGLGAPTAMITKEAGISNGSLFTYFETKAELYNQLYLELKIEMASGALEGFPANGELRMQTLHMWSSWMRWATADPHKRHALKQLAVSDQITEETRAAVHRVMAPLLEVMERVRTKGSMRNTPMNFVGALMNSLAETTMDFMINDPARAEEHCLAGFEAYWRAMG